MSWLLSQTKPKKQTKVPDAAVANPFGLPQSSPAHHPPPPRPPPPTSAATNMGDLLYGIDSGVGSVVAPASCSSGSSPLPVRAIETMDTFDFLSMDSSSSITTTTTTTNNAGSAPAEASASPSKQAAKGAELFLLSPKTTRWFCLYERVTTPKACWFSVFNFWFNFFIYSSMC